MSPAGDPESPVVVMSLDAWRGGSPERIRRMADALASTLRITVGVLESEPAPELAPLLRAMTSTLSAAAGGEIRESVHSADIAADLALLSDAVARTPRASVALAGLLRATQTTDADDASRAAGKRPRADAVCEPALG